MKAELQIPKPHHTEGADTDSRAGARLQALFHHHPDAVLMVELGGRIVEANPAASKMLGWSREELLTKRPWDLVVGVSRLETQEWMRGLVAGSAERVLLNLRTREDARVRVEASVQRVDESKGVCFVVACRELAPLDENGDASTARENGSPDKRWALQLQRHNEALVEAEQRLRLAMELGRVGLWVWNASDTTNPGHWSDRLKEIFGVPLDAEVTHEMFLNCVHPDDRALVDEAVRKAITGHDGGRYSLEYRSIRASDGSEGWVLARGQAFLDEAGQPLRFIGTVVDITERKRAEEALAVLNAGLEQTVMLRTTELVKVIDTIPGLVWCSLPDGNIEYLNQRWLEYTGLSLEEASGWGWQQAIHPDDLEGLVDYWMSILTAGVAGEYEARLRRHDGDYRWFLFRGVPLRDATGAVIKWYGTNTDVEDLRNSRHVARGQIEALTQTLAALSHESDPDRLLEHVLRTIGERLGAHSIGVWEMDPLTRKVELVGNCEDGRLDMNPAPQGASLVQPPAGSETHPVWTEFFTHGRYCVAGKMEPGGARVRVLDGTDSPWHDWRSKAVENPKVPVLMERLQNRGVTSTLSVPMLVAGSVTGFLSIRFSREPDFRCDEIELARALASQAMLAIQLMKLTRESRRLAVVAERNRMARELHDTLSQGITGVLVQLEAAEDASARQLPEAVQHHLSRARELARGSMREARRSVHGMRSQALEKQSLCDALTGLFKSMTEGAALQARFELRGSPWEMRSLWEDNLLRMVQEVLTNTLRHAQATRFTARLTYTPARLRLQMHDNGRGFNTRENHDGFGLVGIRERVETMGGTIFIGSKAGRGTSIGICVPSEKPESGTQA